jgi:cytochrome c-type biogenesis protein CcmH
MLKRFALMMLMAVVCVLPVFAAIEEVDFSDEQQKARYQALIAELRCPMCLNANLAGSDAPIAADLRAEIHEQILAGKSDDEILGFLVDRYGQFILYKPRLQAATALLWFAPPLLLLAGFFILRRMLSNRRQLAAEQGTLTEHEQQRLQALLGNNDKNDENSGASRG